MAHSRRLAVLIVLTFLVAVGAPVARAASDDGKEQAKALFESGMQAFQRGDFASALRTFSAAYAAFPSNKLLFNVGQSALNLGRNGEAVDSFQRFIDGEAATAAADDKRIAFAQKAIRDLRARKKVVEVKVQLQPADAALELDGERAVRDTFNVNRGDPEATHVLKAHSPGYIDGVVSFTVQGTHVAPVVLVLAPIGAPTATKPTTPTQNPTATTPPPKQPAVADVPVATPPSSSQAAVAREPALAKPEGAGSPSLTRTHAYIAFGTAGGLLVGGLAYGALVAHKAGQISGCGGATLSTCASLGNADAKALKTQAFLVDVLFAGAAVAGTAGAVMFYLAPAPGGGAAGVEGSF